MDTANREQKTNFNTHNVFVAISILIITWIFVFFIFIIITIGESKTQLNKINESYHSENYIESEI